MKKDNECTAALACKASIYKDMSSHSKTAAHLFEKCNFRNAHNIQITKETDLSVEAMPFAFASPCNV